MLRAGDRIRVVVSNIDGTPRRSWTAEIEAVDADSVRTITRIGNPVSGPQGRLGRQVQQPGVLLVFETLQPGGDV